MVDILYGAGVITAVAIPAWLAGWRWGGNAKSMSGMREFREEVGRELLVNGAIPLRANEPLDVRDRSMRSLVVELVVNMSRMRNDVDTLTGDVTTLKRDVAAMKFLAQYTPDADGQGG